MKSVNHIDYIGNELELFKDAVNWKRYFSGKLLPYIKGDVLEVGAGIGVNTQYLAADRAAITSWCLVEPDRNLCSQIEANTAPLQLPKMSIVNGTIEAITDQQFDTIIYIDVLEHIEAPWNEMSLIHKRLRPGGRVIVLVPAYKFLYSPFDKQIGHFRRYYKRLLVNEVHGLMSRERLFYLDSLGFFASLANKLLLRKSLPSKGNVKFWDRCLVPPSKLLDILVFRSFGKSLIGIFVNDRED